MKANQAKTLVAAAALALVGGAVAWGPLAHADDVSIAVSYQGIDGTSFSSYDLGSGGGAVTKISAGTFNITDIAANDYFALQSPEALYSQTLNTSASGSGTLTVWILASGLTKPVGTLSSSFTTNQLFNNLTVTESSYFGTSSATIGTSCTGCTQLASWQFNKSNWGTNKLFTNQINSSGTYSLLEEYVINAGTYGGTSNSTINMNFVPEPGSLGMLGLGLSALGALGWMRRRRGRKQN